MTERYYFDNAATSFPKPEAVHEAVARYGREIGASAGRGAYREAMMSGEIIDETRRRVAELINAPDARQVIFTFNCTDGLVLAIKGVVTEPGVHVITTEMDHNSVLRPLAALRDQLGIEVTYLPADATGLVDPADVRRALRPETRLIAVVHGSNVCGSVQDIGAIGAIAREHGVCYLVDAAQTAGHLPLDVQALGVDLLAFPGHKGLLGPLGTGALYVRPGLESTLRPLKEGGTGSKSEEATQPTFMPDRFEAGSHNALGLAGLNEGVRWLLEQGVQKLRQHEVALCREWLSHTGDAVGLHVYGPRDPALRVGVFSVRVDGYSPGELAAVLEQRYGLLTRPGLHCAPLAHRALGTLDIGGTTRFSLGPFHTLEDIRYAAEALVEVAAANPLLA